MKSTFKVIKSNEGQRLDIFLSSVITDSSRSYLQKQIKNGSILLNDQKVLKSNHPVREGDIIKVEIKEKSEKEIVVKPIEMPIDIVFQNKDLVVVNKKHGICVHPAVGNWENTLINGLLYKYKELAKVGSGNKLGLIHRIDKETSGLVLVALSNKALWFFSRQFEEREVEKSYLAVVKGDINKAFKGRRKLQVSNYLGRNRRNRKKITVVEKEKGRIATTNVYHIRTVRDMKLGSVSLVKAMPKTGRTHQIRVHLSNLGFPIIGDEIYGKGVKYKRMMLHAYKLTVKMISGKSRTFQAVIPQEFHKLFDIDTKL
ncbi:RluA family pseudouridine synthase [Patescibacteria group bacterium]